MSTITPYATKAGLKIEKHDELSEEEGRGQAPARSADLVRKVRAEAIMHRHPDRDLRPPAGVRHHPRGSRPRPASLATGEMLVVHVTDDCEVHAIERHRTPG